MVGRGVVGGERLVVYVGWDNIDFDNAVCVRIGILKIRCPLIIHCIIFYNTTDN